MSFRGRRPDESFSIILSVFAGANESGRIILSSLAHYAG
jgi:hypothetical protein